MPNEEIVKKIVGSCQGLVPSIDPSRVIHTFSGFYFYFISFYFKHKIP